MTKEQIEAMRTFFNSFSNAAFAWEQLNLLADGVRDVRLHDNCIILFDAGLFNV